MATVTVPLVLASAGHRFVGTVTLYDEIVDHVNADPGHWRIHPMWVHEEPGRAKVLGFTLGPDIATPRRGDIAAYLDGAITKWRRIALTPTHEHHAMAMYYVD